MSDTRRDVLNADRASNAEVPRSGAVAHQLDEAAKERRAIGLSTGHFNAEHRERAWTRVSMARHGDATGDPARFDRMTATDRGAERYHAGVHARGREGRVEVGERVARDVANAKLDGAYHRDEVAGMIDRAIGARQARGEGARVQEGERLAWQMSGKARAVRAEAPKQATVTASDYWAAKIARGGGQSGGAQAQTREQKEGARRRVAQGVG